MNHTGKDNSIYTPHVCEWRYTVPFSKFNPDNIEDSLKHNIV